MLNNPERAEAVQDQIRRAVETLRAQSLTRTKRAVATAAGCSPTTVMKYRTLWQGEQKAEEPPSALDPLALTPENLSAWQDLEGRFAPLSIEARILGCRADQVTPASAAYWSMQYHRLSCIGQHRDCLGLTPEVLRPYKDRVALLEEAVFTRHATSAYRATVKQITARGIQGLPLPDTARFLDLPFPALAWEYLVANQVAIAAPIIDGETI